MGRPQDQHLNLYELTLLASDKLSGGTRLQDSETDRKELEDHILLCKECRDWFDQEEILLRMSRRLPKLSLSKGSSGCPSEEQWRELAAGLHAPLETQKQIEHAIDCATCSARLKEASEQFADDLDEQEKRLLSGLKSVDPDWQQQMARRMQAASTGAIPLSHGRKGDAPILFPRFVISAAVVGVASLVFAVAWFTYLSPTRAVDRLLLNAYSEHRTNDLRLSGSRYAFVEAFRSNTPTGLRRPTALLEAEVLIAQELASKPDDPFWLDAQGRADLMNDDYSSALSSLERAHRYAPENRAIGIDLASSYFLRGEELKRPDDYGRAVDLLGQVLARDPPNQVARFNRAIALERLLLYDQAVEDWHRYLEFDPSSQWSDEARERLKHLEEKIDLQRKRSEQPIFGPGEFLAALRDDHDTTVKDLDPRIERYFDVALSEWVPAAFRSPPGTDALNTRKALHELSEVLVSKHADHWLADFLNELEQKPLSREALPSLADSVKLVQTSDLDRARKSALDALGLFRASSSYAGEQIAVFELSYADQLTHRVSDCLTEARAGAGQHLAGRYPWIEAQLTLEEAACTSLNDETTRSLVAKALSLARLHHYPSLELRAVTFLAGLYQYLGDTSSAWRYSAEGLDRYWEGDFTAMRGYSLFSALDFVAEDNEQWSLEVQILEQADKFIRDHPDLELRAIHQHRLANALAMAGNLAASERSLQEAHTLLLNSADGTRKNNFEFEAQIQLAKLELLRSRPESAIHRLEPWKLIARHFSDEYFVFDYFRDLGLAYFAVGKPVEASEYLTEAVALAEQSLRNNPDERERLIWSRKSDDVYRALVQLSLPGSPRDSLALWEWSKGASLRGSSTSHSSDVSENISFDPSRVPPISFVVPQDTLVISYAVLPEGIFAWTYSQDGVRPYSLSASYPKVDQLAHRFEDHCSRPDSDLVTLRTESRELYQLLMGPLGSFPTAYKHLVIEPDKSLWLIPFEALLDRQGIYLGDRYSISFSPGLDYLAASSRGQKITKDSRILIAGDPETVGRAPLDDAEAEAKGIAHQFRYSKLLIQTDVGSAQIAKQVGDAEIFHFSGHAAASPDGVGLVLGDSIMDVARVHTSEFSHLKLAVLSACNTANGNTAAFDDRDSLARLLVGAGILDVVASRWMVNSRATSLLMKDFYAHLISGEETSSSLREASHKLRQQKDFAHPFYWAGFSVYGRI